MNDNFLNVFKELISESKYREFCKKKGRPTDIPEELYEVGYDAFVPYMNTECRQNLCIYDLSTIHELYANTFDVSDAFKFNSTFMCFYCGKELRYGDFFTCDSLGEDIEEIFKRKQEQNKKDYVRQKSINSRKAARKDARINDVIKNPFLGQNSGSLPPALFLRNKYGSDSNVPRTKILPSESKTNIQVPLAQSSELISHDSNINKKGVEQSFNDSGILRKDSKSMFHLLRAASTFTFRELNGCIQTC